MRRRGRRDELCPKEFWSTLCFAGYPSFLAGLESSGFASRGISIGVIESVIICISSIRTLPVSDEKYYLNPNPFCSALRGDQSLAYAQLARVGVILEWSFQLLHTFNATTLRNAGLYIDDR